jgi:hypothetical protein
MPTADKVSHNPDDHHDRHGLKSLTTSGASTTKPMTVSFKG